MPSREDWMRRLGPLYGGAVALVHSTSWRWPDELVSEARSPGWVIALGLPIGVVAYIAAAVVHGVGMPVAVAAIVGIAILSLASAAIVERGLVARIDGDERPGTAAILTLVFVTLIRAAAFASMPSSKWLGVLVATAVVGRWAAVFLQSLGDPIDDHSPRSLVATRAPLWLIGAMSLGVLTIAVLALGKAGVLVLAVTAGAAFALGVDSQRRDQGLSAPVVAMAAAIGELCVLLVATLG